MKGKHVQYGIVILFAVLLILFVSKMVNAEEKGFSSGPSNLAYYAVVEDIKTVCPDLHVHNVESKGGMSNFGNMAMRNDVQFGIGPLDALKFYAATNSAKANKLFVVAPLYKNGLQIIASNRSGIKTIGDLRGKRVNIGPVGSGSWVASQLVSIRTGIKFLESTYSTSDSLKRVLSGDLDAAFYFSGVPTPDLVSLGKDGDGIIHLVDMNHPNLINFYEATQVPENTYAWEHDAKTILQVQNYLFVQKGNEDAAGQVAACLKAQLDNLEKIDKLWSGVDLNAEVKWQWSPAAKAALGK